MSLWTRQQVPPTCAFSCMMLHSNVLCCLKTVTCCPGAGARPGSWSPAGHPGRAYVLLRDCNQGAGQSASLEHVYRSYLCCQHAGARVSRTLSPAQRACHALCMLWLRHSAARSLTVPLTARAGDAHHLLTTQMFYWSILVYRYDSSSQVRSSADPQNTCTRVQHSCQIVSRASAPR